MLQGKRKHSFLFQLDAVECLQSIQKAPRPETWGSAKDAALTREGGGSEPNTLVCDTNAQRQLSSTEDETPPRLTVKEVLERNAASAKKDTNFHIAFRQPSQQRLNKPKTNSPDLSAEVSAKQRAIDALRERFTQAVQNVVPGSYNVYYGSRCSNVGSKSPATVPDVHAMSRDTRLNMGDRNKMLE